MRGVAAAAVVGLIVYLFLYFYLSDPPRSLLPRRGVAGFLVAASVLTIAWRFVYIRVFTTASFMRRVVLVGAGHAGRSILQVVNRLNPPPFDLFGVLDDDPYKIGSDLEGFPVLGDSENLLELITREEITDVIVAISGEMNGTTFQNLLEAQEHGVEITRMPVAYEELLGRVPIRLLEADWILRSFVDQNRVSGIYTLIKRLIDILGGLIGVTLTVLLTPFVGLAILIDSGRPVFYSQVRSGKGAQPYQIIKYRTMYQDAEPDGKPRWAKEDDERATVWGASCEKLTWTSSRNS